MKTSELTFDTAAGRRGRWVDALDKASRLLHLLIFVLANRLQRHQVFVEGLEIKMANLKLLAHYATCCSASTRRVVSRSSASVAACSCSARSSARSKSSAFCCALSSRFCASVTSSCWRWKRCSYCETDLANDNLQVQFQAFEICCQLIACRYCSLGFACKLFDACLGKFVYVMS